MTASLLRDPDGRPDVAIGMIEDITERKEIERLKDELRVRRRPRAAHAADLDPRLARPARGRASRASCPTRRARWSRSRARTPSGSSRLVNDTLDLERLEAGRVDARRRARSGPASCSPRPAQVVQPVGRRGGRRAELGGADELELIADPDRIVQTLVNLVANAVKFSPAGHLRDARASSAAGDDALISVADEGRGIPADQLESIFERFRQVDASDRREKGGTGLGLAISRGDRRAARAAGSGPRATPGEGATFRFTLPLLPRGRGRRRLRPPRRTGARSSPARCAGTGCASLAFDDPEALAARRGRFVAVLVAGAGGLEERRRRRAGARASTSTEDLERARRRAARGAQR